VPEISRFYGIVIRMYFGDHNPPHIHAEYSGQKARIDINTLGVFGGSLPARALGLAIEWTSLHREELLDLWQRARNLEPLHRIDPLP
jgi:hypothetical protein